MLESQRELSLVETRVTPVLINWDIPDWLRAAPKGMVLSHFALKTGIDFDYYGLKFGYGFQENRELSVNSKA